jgi:hypothetical protein
VTVAAAFSGRQSLLGSLASADHKLVSFIDLSPFRNVSPFFRLARRKSATNPDFLGIQDLTCAVELPLSHCWRSAQFLITYPYDTALRDEPASSGAVS